MNFNFKLKFNIKVKKFQKIIQFLYSKFFKYLFRLVIFTAMPRQSHNRTNKSKDYQKVRTEIYLSADSFLMT